LDTDGTVREWLTWDWDLPSSDTWDDFTSDASQILSTDCLQQVDTPQLIVWDISGQLNDDDNYSQQTLFSYIGEHDALPKLSLSIAGVDNHLLLSLNPRPNRSPHSWFSPSLPTDKPFHIQFAIHSGMMAGGLLWRWNDNAPWSTLTGSSPWGVERLPWSHDWVIGDTFRGTDLQIKWHHQSYNLNDYLT